MYRLVHKEKSSSLILGSCAFALKSKNVFGPHHGCRSLTQKNIVFRLGLRYKSADYDKLRHSSKFQECFKNPDIFGPPCDCLNCGGTGCQYC